MFAILIVVATLLVAPACEAPSQPTFVSLAEPRADLAPVRFSGRAVDYSTGAGVPNVPVEIDTEVGQSLVPEARATTDAVGSYTLAIRPGSYLAAVNGVFAGLVHVTTGGSRGDFLARQGTCVSRYGVVADAQSRRPIAGVRVELSGQTATTDQEGWYRVDFGCPANGLFGFNTTLIFFSHPGYDRACAPAGRGVFGAERFDFFLGGRSTRPACVL
jgi:hypothetical protein